MGAVSSTENNFDPIKLMNRNIESLVIMLQYLGDDKAFFQNEVIKYQNIEEAFRIYQKGPTRLLAPEANRTVDQLKELLQNYKKAMIIHMKTYILCRSIIPKLFNGISTYVSMVTLFLNTMRESVQKGNINVKQASIEAEKLYNSATKFERQNLVNVDAIQKQAQIVKDSAIQKTPGQRQY
jgi:hypothetical protein